MNPFSHRFSLRDLPLATRLVIAAFLVSVGIGYFAALIQLHFQHASPGKLLPDAEDTANAYHGRTGMSQLERLLVSDENKPFNGSGSMRQTFTIKSAGWKTAIKRRARDKGIAVAVAEEQLRSERDGERLAVLDWIRTGASRRAFEENNHVLSANLVRHPITSEFAEAASEGSVRVKVGAIFEERRARCHREDGGAGAGRVPLETWEQVHDYCEVDLTGGGASLKKLAQSSHIHLLGFAMLYGLTGLIVSLTSYPGWLRLLLAPLPLVVQLGDISMWWLARLDPDFARAIIVSGAIVATGLFLQITLSLFNLFGRTGKVMLVILLLSACLGGYVIKERVIDPYMAKESVGATAPE